VELGERPFAVEQRPVSGLLSPSQARRLAVTIAGVRVAVGLAAMVVPDTALRPWVGSAGQGPARRVLARSLGARDVALGLGVLVADRRGAPIRGWVEAAVLADAGDVGGTLAALPHLPKAGRLLVLASAAGAVAAGAVAAASL
jgi:peptide-methionine (R)-S-oxide reductase